MRRIAGPDVMPTLSRVLRATAIAVLAISCGRAVGAETAAEDSGRGRGGLALAVFGLSLHTDRSESHNEVNPGLGLRYSFAPPDSRWEAFGESSFYYDSNREWAKYVAGGAAYRLADSWKAGAALAWVQSPGYNKGKPFLAIVPSLGYQSRRFTVNAVLLPSEHASSKIAGLAFYLTVPIAHPR